MKNNSFVWLAVLATLAPLPCLAQVQPPGLRDAYVMEIRTGDRWLHAAQQPLFAPFRDARNYVALSQRERRADGTTIYVAAPETGTRITNVNNIAFSVLADGRLLPDVQASVRPVSMLPGFTTRDSLRQVYSLNYESVPLRTFMMPESRVWGLIPVVRALQLERGVRWVDTLAHEASDPAHHQSLTGIRTSTVVGDTVVGGNRLWIIADSTSATLTERFLEEEVTLDTEVVIERSARGVIRGRHLFDPALRLFRLRSDTTALTGTVTLRYPDGRSYNTAARFDQRRDYILHTTRSFTARTEALNRNIEVMTDRLANTSFNDLQQRLRENEQKATDSVFAAWSATRDPLTRHRILSYGSGYGRAGGAALATRITEALRSEGVDSAQLVAELMRTPRDWTVAAVRDVLIPFTGDPGGALAHGYRRNDFYTFALRHMLETPPAITPDTTMRVLSGAVLDFLEQQGRTATDPRLKDIGLLSLFLREPSRWSDSVLARRRAGSVILIDAAYLVDGATAYALGTPIPASGATWRDWHHWIIGPTPAVARPGAPARPRAMTFSPAHSRAIRMFEARTGRPMVGELRAAMRTADNDSARLVLTTILQGLGEITAGADEIAQLFRTGRAADITQGRASMLEYLRNGDLPLGRGAPPRVAGARGPVFSLADSATAVAITTRMVEHMLEGGALLRNIEQKHNVGVGTRVFLPVHNPQRLGLYFTSDSLPAATIATLQSRAKFIRASDWVARDTTQQGMVVSFSPVRRTGPIVVALVSWSDTYVVNGVRRGGGGGGSLYFMEIDGEWVVLYSTGGVS